MNGQTHYGISRLYAPEIVLPTIFYFDENYPFMISDYGFKRSFNLTFPGSEQGWVSEGYYGLDQGPIVLMIENAHTNFTWHRCGDPRLLLTVYGWPVLETAGWTIFKSLCEHGGGLLSISLQFPA